MVLLSRVGNSVMVFLSNRSFFVIEKSKDRFDHEKIESLPSIFCKDGRDRVAHGQSFLKMDGIESLTVNLVKRSTRLIRSKISKDRRSKGRKIELSTLHMNREQNIHS